ncbi:hypothetical protein [Lapillicoccus sp.]|nr:hypothetical protein [Lapillicoccus sp.]
MLIVGHVATRCWDHHLEGLPLATLAEEQFAWQPGWEYTLA